MAEITLLSSTPGGLTDAQLDRNMQNLNEELAGKLPLGGFGVGGEVAPSLTTTDLDTFFVGGLYRYVGSTPNAPFPGIPGTLQVIGRSAGGTAGSQMATACSGAAVNRLAFRSKNGGVLTPWAEVWSTLNLEKQSAADDKTAGRVLLTGAHNLGVGSFAKNKIINGKMEIAQRGTAASSPPAVETFLIDRWFTFSVGAASSITQSGGPSAEFPKALSMTGAAGVTGLSAWTRLESRDTTELSGKPVTLRAQVYSTDASTLTCSVLAAGAVNNFSTRPTKHSVSASVPAGWSEFKVVIPAFDAQAASNGAQIGIGWGATGAGIVRAVTGVQLEVGSVATPFEHRPYGQELALCHRYYWVATDNFVLSGPVNGSTAKFDFPVPMRATPTITHGYSDANYVAAPGPASGQWGVQIAGIAVVTKSSGTISVAWIANNNKSAVMYIAGQVWNAQPNWLVTNYDLTLAPRFSAEL